MTEKDEEKKRKQVMWYKGVCSHNDVRKMAPVISGVLVTGDSNCPSPKF